MAPMTKASLSAVLRLLRVQAAIETRFSAGLGSVHGLGLTELLLLMNLDRAPLKRMRRVDLAAALAMSQSSVTRMVLPLEKIGLVTRDADPRDARIGYVVLTDTGAERVAEAVATLDQMSESLFVDRWTGDEVETLADLLGRLSGPLPGTLG